MSRSNFLPTPTPPKTCSDSEALLATQLAIVYFIYIEICVLFNLISSCFFVCLLLNLFMAIFVCNNGQPCVMPQACLILVLYVLRVYLSLIRVVL